MKIVFQVSAFESKTVYFLETLNFSYFAIHQNQRFLIFPINVDIVLNENKCEENWQFCEAFRSNTKTRH